MSTFFLLLFYFAIASGVVSVDRNYSLIRKILYFSRNRLVVVVINSGIFINVSFLLYFIPIAISTRLTTYISHPVCVVLYVGDLDASHSMLPLQVFRCRVYIVPGVIKLSE